MRRNGLNVAARRSRRVALLALLLTSGCAATMGVGSDAGCASYGEARLMMPRDVPLPKSRWGDWIADTDDRMTGACRG